MDNNKDNNNYKDNNNFKDNNNYKEDFNLEDELKNFDQMESSIDKLDKKYSDRDMFKDDKTEGTNKDKNFNITSFVSDLEKKLDNFDNIKFQTNKDVIKSEKKEDSIKIKPKKKHTLEKKILNILIEVKKPFIVILLFILLNNKDLIELINNIPYVNYFNNDYPSLIIRGGILGLIIYNLKNIQNNF